MSRRLSERALPDFSQLIDRDSQLALLDEHEQGSARQVSSEADDWPRFFIGRCWLRTLAMVGHLAHRAGTPIPCLPVSAGEQTGESR